MPSGTILTKEKMIEQVLTLCDKNNFTLIDVVDFVHSRKNKIKLKCNIDGYEWCTTYFRLSRGDGCPKCAGNSKPTQDEATELVLKICKERNITLMKPFIYKNNEIKIQLRCNIDGYEWTPRYSKFTLYNKCCPMCIKHQKITQEYAIFNILKICKEKNYTLINDIKYKNISTIIILKCNKDNYEWNTTYGRLINNGNGCPKCSNLGAETKEVMNINILQKCKEKNYILMKPFVYKNSKSKMYLKCLKDNYEWGVTYYSFIKNDTGCSRCLNSKGEKIILNYLNDNIIIFFNQYKFKDCIYKKQLIFDFYLPDYNLCIEYDGIQHFKPFKYFGGETSFNDIKIKDNIKTDYCNINNIKLIRITYKEINNIKNILNDIFKNKERLI